MPRPIVEIHQEVLNTTTSPADPDLKVVIVGPKYHVVDYPDDQGDTPDGEYDVFASIIPMTAASAVFESVLPGFEPASMSLDITSDYAPKIFAENVVTRVAEYTNVEFARTSGKNVLTVVANSEVGGTANLIAMEVAVGDIVRVKNDAPTVITLAETTNVSFLDKATFANSQAHDIVPNVSKVKIQEINDVAFGSPNYEWDILKVTANQLYLADKGAAPNLAGLADGDNVEFTILKSSGGTLLHTEATATGATLEAIGVVTSAVKALGDSDSAQGNPLNSDLSVRLSSPLYFKNDTSWSGYGTSSIVQVRFERAQAYTFELDADQVSFETSSGTVYLGSGASDNVAAVGTFITVPATVDADEPKVVKADFYYEYRALVTNDTTVVAIESSSDVTGNIGPIDPRCPLALAADIAVANSGGEAIYCLPITSDDSTGYSTALQQLNSDPEVYVMIPLSQDLANVIVPYKNGAVAQSVPAKGKFRIVIGSSVALPDTKYLVGSAAAPSETGTTIAASDIFEDPSADFTDANNLVVVGDLLTINHAGHADDGLIFQVGEVLSATTLGVLDEDGNATTFSASAVDVGYTLTRDISGDKASRITELLGLISAHSSPRLVMTYPGTCTARGFANVEGYYLSAALGGVMASTPPHQPKNQIGLAAIEAVSLSNFYFSDDQIDEISDGGYFVFVQDTPNGAPYCIHQLTTGTIANPGVQEYEELSVVANFDFVSKYFKDRLTPYVGVWNVIPQAFSSIRTTIESGLQDLTNRGATRIGPPVLSGTLDFLRQASYDAGTLEGNISVQLPKVLNTLVIHIIST